MEKRSGVEAVSYGFLSLATKYIDIDKQAHNYGTDTQIYNSEIHLISEIAKNPDIHVRGLAEKLGITSASVSEMISKLEKKRLVQKSADKDNLSRIRLSLTTKGHLAHEEHLRYHKELNAIVEQELHGASEEQIKFLLDFFARMSERLENYHF